MARNLTITLTLDDEDIETLIDTLELGANSRYAPSLQAKSRRVAEYVQERIDAAKSRKHVISMKRFQEELTRVGIEMDKQAGIIK